MCAAPIIRMVQKHQLSVGLLNLGDIRCLADPQNQACLPLGHRLQKTTLVELPQGRRCFWESISGHDVAVESYGLASGKWKETQKQASRYQGFLNKDICEIGFNMKVLSNIQVILEELFGNSSVVSGVRACWHLPYLFWNLFFIINYYDHDSE